MRRAIFTVVTYAEPSCGVMQYNKLFITEAAAHEWAKAQGLQNEEKGSWGQFRLDYYKVQEIQTASQFD